MVVGAGVVAVVVVVIDATVVVVGGRGMDVVESWAAGEHAASAASKATTQRN